MVSDTGIGEQNTDGALRLQPVRMEARSERCGGKTEPVGTTSVNGDAFTISSSSLGRFRDRDFVSRREKRESVAAMIISAR